MHARLRGSKSLLKPDFPSLADEIAEQRPGMNIKVAAFTVGEKSSKTYPGTVLPAAPSIDLQWCTTYRLQMLITRLTGQKHNIHQLSPVELSTAP